MPVAHTLTQVTLAGGERGLIIDIPGAPVTKFGISFHTGSSSTERGWPHQAAHIVEHIAAAYTTDQKYPTPNDLTNDIERQGAYTNATTTSMNVAYYGYCAADEWRRVVDLFALPITAPAIDESSLAAERGNVIEELNGYASDHEQVAWELARKALTHEWLTSRESIEDALEVTAETARAAYDATHTRRNMRFIVAGDIAGDRRMVETLFNEWPIATGLPLETAKLSFTSGGAYKYARRRSLTTIANTLLFTLDRSPTVLDREAIDVLGYLLFNSQSSRILGAARERGICYGMTSSVDLMTNDQLTWAIEFSVGPDNMRPVTELIVSELERVVTTGFTDDEIDRAKTYNLGLLRMSGQTAGELYDGYESDFFKRGRVTPYDEIEAVYDSITGESLTALLRELLSGAWALGGVGPGANMEYKDYYDTFTDFLGKIQ